MKILSAYFFLFCGVLLAVASSASAVDKPGAGPVPPPAGSTVLWNGRDLTGWTVFLQDPKAHSDSAWSTNAGVLYLAGRPAGYMRTEKTFSNYHLHIEWRWPEKAGNSGVFVHLTGPDKIWPTAAQCQVKDQSVGDLIGMSGFDFSPSVLSNKNKLAVKLAAPSEQRIGDWNTYEIFCRDDTIDVYVNGAPQNHVEKTTATSGFIALQMEGSPIEFRNLWLRPL